MRDIKRLLKLLKKLMMLKPDQKPKKKGFNMFFSNQEIQWERKKGFFILRKLKDGSEDGIKRKNLI